MNAHQLAVICWTVGGLAGLVACWFFEGRADRRGKMAALLSIAALSAGFVNFFGF
jgi:hypothetical protein